MAACRHDADDPGRETERIARTDEPADARSAADRRIDGIEVPDRAKELEGVRCDAGAELGSERTDELEALVARTAGRVNPGLVEIAAVLDQLGAQLAHRRVLFDGVAERHDDHAAQVVAPRREREALAVVAACCADDPLWPRRALGKQADEVEPAAHLERADRGMVFVLHPYLAAGALREERPRILRRRRHRGIDTKRSGFDGGEIDHGVGAGAA